MSMLRAFLTLFVLMVLSIASPAVMQAQSPGETVFTAKSKAGRDVTVTVNSATRQFVTRIVNTLNGSTVPDSVQKWTVIDLSTGVSRDLSGVQSLSPGRYRFTVVITTRLGSRSAIDTATVDDVLLR
jgi:hypothetical protein